MSFNPEDLWDPYYGGFTDNPFDPGSWRDDIPVTGTAGRGGAGAPGRGGGDAGDLAGGSGMNPWEGGSRYDTWGQLGRGLFPNRGRNLIAGFFGIPPSWLGSRETWAWPNDAPNPNVTNDYDSFYDAVHAGAVPGYRPTDNTRYGGSGTIAGHRGGGEHGAAFNDTATDWMVRMWMQDRLSF